MKSPVPNAKLLKYPAGNIYQGYGENPALYIPWGLAFHNGIDIATFEGDKCVAVVKGIVVDVILNPTTGYGNSVVIVSDIQPDGTYFCFRYAYLRADIPVSVGQEVNEGDLVGYMSNTGFVISGQTQFFGNAPANRGVHLHFGIQILTDPDPSVSGGVYYPLVKKAFTIKNYNNGVHGAVDPMLYLNTMLDLYKEIGRESTFAKVNGKYLWISYERMQDFIAAGLARWEDVKEISDKIIQEGVIS